MENFVYCAPTKVIFGKGTISTLKDEILNLQAGGADVFWMKDIFL